MKSNDKQHLINLLDKLLISGDLSEKGVVQIKEYLGKRKRGRPRKVVTEIPPKRQRGRPKKESDLMLTFLWAYWTLGIPNDRHTKLFARIGYRTFLEGEIAKKSGYKSFSRVRQAATVWRRFEKAFDCGEVFYGRIFHRGNYVFESIFIDGRRIKKLREIVNDDGGINLNLLSSLVETSIKYSPRSNQEL